MLPYSSHYTVKIKLPANGTRRSHNNCLFCKFISNLCLVFAWCARLFTVVLGACGSESQIQFRSELHTSTIMQGHDVPKVERPVVGKNFLYFIHYLLLVNNGKLLFSIGRVTERSFKERIP